MFYDVLVIGGGPAGLSAAVNLRARGKTAAVISNPIEENPLWRSARVENYLGLPGVTGQELLDAFRRHAETAGASFISGRALNAALVENTWYVSVGSEVYEAGAVVLAAGASRGSKFPGEEEFLGRGVSYCATCDGMLYRGKRAVVLGWTDSARQEAEFLRSIGCLVTYLHRPRSCRISQEGDALRLTHAEGAADADGIFILRPSVAPTDLFPGLELKDGWVSVDRRMATGLPGVFAAGDCTGEPLQVSKAAGEGLIAGQSAARWVDAHAGAKPAAGK
ncbi:MAG: NAD(P)/FAD-dependent oxidoreductase [Oscillibacter sp.]|jgi:thioredoxin reductase (NADPH)|nr:NAD(P)/FAD-dependent oxidoreductase [Oscillibacter sp.]